MLEKDTILTGDGKDIVDKLLVFIPGAVRYACRRYQYSISPDELEDFCQEITVLLIENNYRRLQTFNGKSSAKTWVYSVVKRHLRRRLQGRYVTTNLEVVPLNFLIAAPEQEKSLLSRERWRVLRTALAELPEFSQHLFHLSIEGLSDTEIAGRIGVKVDVVRRRRYRLIRRLKQLVGRQSVDDYRD